MASKPRNVRERDSLILVAGCRPERWRLVQKALAERYPIAFSIDVRGTLEQLERERPRLLLVCSDLLDLSTSAFVERMLREGESCPQMVVFGDSGGLVRGGSSLLHVSEKAGEDGLLAAVQKALNPEVEEAPAPASEPHRSRSSVELPAYREMILGSSRPMRQAVDMIRRIARVDVTVLLCGETGTGKEMFARRIHCMSERSRGPFRPLNLGAVPSELFESVLFGHERGAFTGAVAQNAGAFEQADQGSLFLDEVSSLKLSEQPKLLRVLQEKEIEPVGARGPRKVDVRIVAATNLNLLEAVERDEFREDLYHRLSVITIEIPPLRRRPDDIPALVDFFVHKYASEYRLDVPDVCDSAMTALKRHPWPGNVRELENRVQRALLLGGKSSLKFEDFMGDAQSSSAAWKIHFGGSDYSLEEVEQAYIEQTLTRTEGNQSRAAQILGIDRKTLRAKRKRASEGPKLCSVS